MRSRFELERPLAPLTTFELGGPAERLARVTRRGELIEALRSDPEARVLGGGSNLVVSDEGVRGTVLAIETRGVQLEPGTDCMELTAQAGERWQDVVDLALAHNLAGLECLTGIPGSVGATPIQNVGAYGQEVSECLQAVEVFERRTGRVAWLRAEQCGLAYRDSLFKRQPDRYVVLSVRFALAPGGAPQVRYAELSRALDARTQAPTLAEVASTVLALRAQKSMVWRKDDPNRRSAGSFFTNPVLSAPEADAVLARAVADGSVERPSEVPRFETPDGRVKLSAGWLVEHAGFKKGTRRAHVGVSSRHALSLVHHGGGTTAELLALAREIREGVHARFGVTLHMEPTCWGTSLG